jgi:formylglycine-generating enzyme required for sulfatase activity
MRIHTLTLVIMLSATALSVHHRANSQEKQPADNIVSQPDSIIIHLPGLDSTEKQLVMMLVLPGTFTMGSEKIPANPRNTPWPPHEVTLTRPFYISQYEITQAQYEALRGHNSNHSLHKGPDLPVEKVSWYDTQLFIRKLNHLNQGVFRLPTEAEWEYTCRKSSQFEVWDMEGSLAEWCEDKWQKSHPRQPQTNPRNKGTLFQFLWPLTNRVFRGFDDKNDPNLTLCIRDFEQSLDYHYSIGFRIVRMAD